MLMRALERNCSSRARSDADAENDDVEEAPDHVHEDGAGTVLYPR